MRPVKTLFRTGELYRDMLWYGFEIYFLIDRPMMNPVDVVGSITSIIQSYPRETKVSTKPTRWSIRIIYFK